MAKTSPFYASLATLAYPLFRMKLEPLVGVEYLPRSGGYILAANHVDWLDGFYIAAAVDSVKHIPVHFLTTSNNYWWTTVTIQIPEVKSEIIPRVVAELKLGKVICNFPEGQRNGTSQLGLGKTGTVRMAAEAQVPIIPVGIKITGGKNMGESISNLLSTSHRVTIAFGEPILVPTRPLSGEELQAETSRVMKAIAPLCAKHA